MSAAGRGVLVVLCLVLEPRLVGCSRGVLSSASDAQTSSAGLTPELDAQALLSHMEGAQGDLLAQASAWLDQHRAGTSSMLSSGGPLATPASATPAASLVQAPVETQALPMSNFVEAGSFGGWSSEPKDTSSPQHQMSAAEKLATEFQYSMVRIQTISESFNWFKPFAPGPESSAVGSGFAVVLNAIGSEPVPPSAERDPVFVTNAHVVRNAHTVRIQVPAMSQQDFGAYVPLIYDHLDLALVRLTNPKDFLDTLNASRAKLKILPIREDPPMSMGMEVAALGFPLGSPSLKLSRGVIAGTEQVEGKLCFQSTAPISPGSSGGPLFAIEAFGKETVAEPQVIGVNFAAASSQTAQNNNYVVPLVHIRQLLNEFLIREKSGQGQTVGPASPASGIRLFAQNKPSKEPLQVKVQPGSAAGQANMRASGKPSEKADASAAKHDMGSVQEAADSRKDVQDRQNRQGHVIADETNDSNDVLTDKRTPVNAEAADTRRTASSAHVVQASEVQPQQKQEVMGQRMSSSGLMEVRHSAMRMAPVQVVAVQANPILYSTSNNCTTGVFLAKIPKPSVLDGLPEQSFLVAVDGAPLDSFGMGRHAGYLGNPLPFQNLLALRDRIEDNVTLTVCKNGIEKNYTVSMAWDSEKYDLGVPVIEEPYFQASAKDYEVFAGVTVAEMTLNHAALLLKAGADPSLGRFLDAETRKSKRLIVVHTQSGSYASRVLQAGMIIEKINGQSVSNLTAYRKSFLSSGPVWKLETDKGVLFEASFVDSLKWQLAMMQNQPFAYLFTPAVKGYLMVLAQMQAARAASAARQGVPANTIDSTANINPPSQASALLAGGVQVNPVPMASALLQDNSASAQAQDAPRGPASFLESAHRRARKA